mgnify:CR=1 FL=1
MDGNGARNGGKSSGKPSSSGCKDKGGNLNPKPREPISNTVYKKVGSAMASPFKGTKVKPGDE